MAREKIISQKRKLLTVAKKEDNCRKAPMQMVGENSRDAPDQTCTKGLAGRAGRGLNRHYTASGAWLDLCKGLAGWSIGSVGAFGMKGSEFEPQTTHWWDRAGPCVGGNSRNLLIATSDHATSDRLLIIDIDYQNYWSIIDIDYATHQGKWGSLLFTIKWGSLFRAVVRFE